MAKSILIASGMILVLVIIIVVLIPWLSNGGWPSSGPVGDALPPHITYVSPADGQSTSDLNGFCVHFDYQAARGLDKEQQESMRYFLDGVSVTKKVYDIVSLEYPTQVGEPCFRSSQPLSEGWHTAKVSYKDRVGGRYEYIWRYQVINE